MGPATRKITSFEPDMGLLSKTSGVQGSENTDRLAGKAPVKCNQRMNNEATSRATWHRLRMGVEITWEGVGVGTTRTLKEWPSLERRREVGIIP